MTLFSEWCETAPLAPVAGHRVGVLVSRDDDLGARLLTARLPSAYATSESLALLAEGFGKPGVARFLRNKLPTKANARSGDMGEILATAYLQEECGYVVGPSRLIQRDHQEWAMRGDDVLGARLSDAGTLHLTKAEAKSKVNLRGDTVEEARAGLQRNEEMPSPHSLTQFAERLLGTGDHQVGRSVIELQLADGVRPEHVGHLMFLFTEGDPSAYVRADLEAYSGKVRQLTITLHVSGHKKFIRDAYQGAVAGDA